METRTVVRASILPASKAAVFERLRQLSTLRQLAAPLAGFTPLDGGCDLTWKVGSRYAFFP